MWFTTKDDIIGDLSAGSTTYMEVRHVFCNIWIFAADRCCPSVFYHFFFILTHSRKLFRKSVCVFSFTLCPLSGIILDGTNKHVMLYFRLWIYTLRLTHLVESVVIIVLKWSVITWSAWLYMNVELAHVTRRLRFEVVNLKSITRINICSWISWRCVIRRGNCISFAITLKYLAHYHIQVELNRIYIHIQCTINFVIVTIGCCIP